MSLRRSLTEEATALAPRVRNAAQNGFTVIELMVVLSIIAVLLAVALPAFSKARTNSRLSQARADLAIISSAVLQLAWDTGKWPSGEDRSVPYGNETWDLTTGAAGLLQTDGRFPSWQGPYIPSVRPDPWGMPYFCDDDYLTDKVNQKSHPAVGSFGPNRVGQNVYDDDDIYIQLD
jgi:general secretion pathway protein G